MSTLPTNNRIVNYVSIVGIERAGKGTLLESLKGDPGLAGVHFVHEPGSTPRADIFRAVLKPKEESVLETVSKESLRRIRDFTISPEVYYHTMMAARHDLLQTFASGESKSIISDRGHLCTLAYQCYGQELHDYILYWQEDYKRLFQDTGINDLHILLDISPEESVRRRPDRRSTDNFDSAEFSFYKKVREGYLSGLAFIRGCDFLINRTVIVNGERDPDIVLSEVRQIVHRHLKL